MALRFLNSGYFAGSVGIGTVTNSAEETNNGIPRLQVTTATAVLGEFPLAARFTTDSDAGDNSGVSVLINSGNDRGLMISAGRAVSNRTRATLNLVSYDGNELVDGLTLYMPNTGVTGATTGTNVGIGTTTPDAKLEVSYTNTGIGAIVGNTTHNSQLQIYTAAAGKNSEIWFGDAGDADVGKIDYDHANDSMSFFIGATKRLSFDSAGTMLLGDTATAYQTIFFDPTPSTVYGNGTLQIQPTTSPGSGIAQFTTNFADRVGGGTTKHNVRVGGTVTATDFIGGSGAYLPLAGGTLTGPLIVDTAGGAEKMTFNNEYNTAPIADSFVGNTSKSYISFGVVAGSNDPGFIMHESSSVAAYQNMGVLHLCPSDDNSTNDYVSIHGSNDPDVLKLHTSGLIETVNLQLQIKSGLNAVFVNDDLQVQNGGSFGGNLSVNGSNITLNGAYPRFNMYSTDVGEDDYSIINNNGTFGIYNNTEAFFPLSLAETSGNATFAGSLSVVGDIITGSALLSNQENTDIDTGAEVVAQVAHATYTAAFFDFVVKKGTNVRSGTVYACHNGDTTPLVEFTETSTNDLGDTSDVTLSVDISGGNMRLLATVTSDDWSVKSLIRAI